ncbi:hypothetical protein, partial [Clavibacter michiganensis]|uniref:hypothetical protein n=1 Tax=Clavibacter michiganensis TaxID=28447 RepID=UPI001C2068C4
TISTTHGKTNPYATVRSPEAQREVDERKAAYEVSTGRKTSAAEVTDRDSQLKLEPLAVLRGLTLDQLSILGTAEPRPGATDTTGDLLSPRSVANRMGRLKEAGVVECAKVIGGTNLWGVTKTGIGAALRFGRIGAEGQINKRVSGIDTDKLAHFEAVNWVAAQLLSPAPYWKKAFKLPPRVDLSMLRTEYQLTNDWLTVNKMLAEKRALGEGFNEKFKDWRSGQIIDSYNNAQQGRIEWSDLLAWDPGLWIPAHKASLGKDLNEHHIPDLVVDLERFRKSEKRVSIAIEVELTPKDLRSYERQFASWARELVQIQSEDKPVAYSKLIYFTNSAAVVDRVTKAAGSLITDGHVTILPLTGRDGTSKLRLTNRTTTQGERK